jgi:hypothetical protein
MCRYLLNTFTQAALWDRSFGGSTIVIHVEGSHQPNVPNVPENTRAAVYLPPYTVVKELPEAHETIASIVQMFIESVGIPTINRWTAAAKNHLNFPLTMSGNSRAPVKSYTSFIPPPVKAGQAHYIFQGLPSHISIPNRNRVQLEGRDNQSPNDPDLSDNEPYNRKYQTRFSELETNYLEQISSLGEEVVRYKERIILLEEEIARLNAIFQDHGPALSTRSFPSISSPGVSSSNPRTPTKMSRSTVSSIFM